MRWAGHVARMGEMINAYNILVGNPEAKKPLEDLGVNGKIILKLILQSYFSQQTFVINAHLFLS
jgi:hypothetical protein